MEGNPIGKPNEEGGDSLANNANDWRSQHDQVHESDLRTRVILEILKKLKICFPKHSDNDIDNTAFKFEGHIYGMSTDKDDYLRRIREKIMAFDKKFKIVQSNIVQSGSSVNGANTPDPAAQALNQGQSLPTSFPYTQTPTSQHWFPQNNIQSNLNVPESSGLPTQVSINVAAAQNLNIQMGEGVHSNLLTGSQRQDHGRQQLLPQPQQQPQSSNDMFQRQVDQQLLKENIRHGNLRPPYMQQQAQQQQNHQQSLLKQPIQQQLPHHTSSSTIQQPMPHHPSLSTIQQQLPHHTSLSTNQQSFPQSSALSRLTSSGQQNSQFLPRHQFPTQRVHSSDQQQMAVPSQEQKRQEREQLSSQLMNGLDTQQTHLTSRQNNGEQQGDFTVSSFQQNNIASFQETAQQNNNLRNMHQQQRLYSHSNNASALTSQQQEYMPGGQSGNFNVHGSSLLGTQGQEFGQSQPMMLQQYQPQHPVQQQPQNRILQKHVDDIQRFQAAGSLHQTQNVSDQHNQPYQLQRSPPENPSTSQDSSGKTVNASGGDWQEETYQKIKALKEKYFPVLSTLLQKLSDKLQEIDSLPQQKMQYEPIKKLRAGKSALGHVMMFLDVHRNSISETHRDRYGLYEEQVLRLTKHNQTLTRRPMQHQQGQFHQTALQSHSGHQVHVSQSRDNDQMNSRLMPSHQNGASSIVSGLTTSQTAMPRLLQTRPRMEPKDENNIMSSSGNAVSPSLKQNPSSNPQVVQSNISPAQSSMFQQKEFHHLPMQHQLLQRQQQQPQTNQQHFQMPKNEMNDLRMRQGVNVKAGLLQQHLSSIQRQIPKPRASPSSTSNFSPPASSPQIQNYSSPQLVDQQILPTTFNKTGTSSQSGGSPFVAPSPVTFIAPSPNLGDPDKPISVESPVSHDYQPQTADQEHPPSFSPQPNAERPIDRLIKAFQSSSPESLGQSVSEMISVISLADRLAGSVHSIGGSRARLAEDLSARTNFRLQQGETNPTKRFKRSIASLPLEIASQTDSYKQFSSLESEVDSTASSGSKVNNIEPGCALLQEIKEINGKLVETVVNICNEEVYPSEVTSGTIVTCSYSPVALSATFEAHYKSGHISQIQPLRLLVPANYPYSPILLLEKIPSDASLHKYEDLSARTRSRFSLSMKESSEPMSLKEIAQVWDVCARATMVEYAERHGGGTFSSKYGHWESVVGAS